MDRSASDSGECEECGESEQSQPQPDPRYRYARGQSTVGPGHQLCGYRSHAQWHHIGYLNAGMDSFRVCLALDADCVLMGRAKDYILAARAARIKSAGL